MALRYVTDFYSIQTGGQHHYEIEIDDNTYVGEPSVLELGAGGVSLDIESDEQDTFPTVMPSFLNIDLIADESFELNHIYTDNERALKVTLKQDGSVLGQYYVVPDGTRESFTTVPYNVSVRCIDGLGLMKNYNYVRPANIASVLESIAACLSNTGLSLNINVYNTLIYGTFFTGNTYEHVKINQERFNGMKCDEVLEQLLKEWVSGLVQVDGEWYLFRWPDVIRHADGNIEFRRYDANGVFIETFTRSLDTILGTDGESGIDLMHCNVDQVRSVNMPYKSVSIKYNYGFIENLLNPETQFLMGLGLEFDGWNKQNGVDAVPRGLNEYAVINGKSVGGQPDDQRIIIKNPPNVVGGQKVKIEIEFNVGRANSIPYTIGFIEAGQPTLYYGPGGQWTTVFGYRYFDNYIRDDGGTYGLGETILGTETVEIPEFVNPAAEGKLHMLIGKAYYYSDNNYAATTPGLAQIYQVNMFPSPSDLSIISETHTVVNNGAYTNVPDPIEVATGESKYEAYLGTMFRTDGVTPTNGFRRYSDEPLLPFLTIAAEDILYQHGFPMTRYEGSILGYFPVLSRFTINMLPGKYMPVKLSYDFKNNVVNSTLNQVNAEPVPHTVNEVVYEEEKPRQVGASDGQ